MSPLTQGLNYLSACDVITPKVVPDKCQLAKRALHPQVHINVTNSRMIEPLTSMRYELHWL